MIWSGERSGDLHNLPNASILRESWGMIREGEDSL
jgi:hypothetical protein